MNRFKDMDMEAVREKAKESMAAKKAWAVEHLDQEWEDESHWRMLASKHGVRLPNWWIPNTSTKYIKRVFQDKGIDIGEYLEDCGCKTVKQLAAFKPTFPCWVEIGFALEYIDERSTTGDPYGL